MRRDGVSKFPPAAPSAIPSRDADLLRAIRLKNAIKALERAAVVIREYSELRKAAGAELYLVAATADDARRCDESAKELLKESKRD